MNRAIQTLRGAAVYIPDLVPDEKLAGPSEAEFATALAQIDADLRELEWAREQLRLAAEDTTNADLREQIEKLETEFEQELERKDLALRHYADEENWREASLQGRVFEYDGGWELPWEIARAGLAKPEPEPERCRSLHAHPTQPDYFIRCGREDGHEGHHQLVSETGGTVSWEDEETYLN